MFILFLKDGPFLYFLEFIERVLTNEVASLTLGIFKVIKVTRYSFQESWRAILWLDLVILV